MSRKPKIGVLVMALIAEFGLHEKRAREWSPRVTRIVKAVFPRSKFNPKNYSWYLTAFRKKALPLTETQG